MTLSKFIESFVILNDPEIELRDRGMTIRGLPAALQKDKRFANRQVNWVRICNGMFHNPTLTIVLKEQRR